MNEYKNERREESEDGRGAIYPKEERGELVLLDGHESAKNVSERKIGRLWALPVLLAVLGSAVVAFCALIAPQDHQTDAEPEEEEDSYVGILESEAAARRCIASSVSLRLGAADELGGESVSGVIVSNDGWILSGAPAFKGERGRIYARLWDGRDIPVEEVRYDGEGRMTLYRICEEGLTVAELSDGGAIPEGTELIAISSCGAPDYACALLSGVMSHTDRSVRIEQGGNSLRLDGLLQVDLSLGEYGCGAPLFDKGARLVGVSVDGGLNYFTGIERISKFLGKIN